MNWTKLVGLLKAIRRMKRTELVEVLKVVRRWVLAIFVVGYAALMLQLAGVLGDLPGLIWEFYEDKLLQYPVRSVFVVFEVITGLFVMRILRQQIPKRDVVTAAGGTFVGHFFIQTIFWFAILLEFPIAVLFTIYGASIQAHLIALGLLALSVITVFFYLWFRPTFRSDKFRGFFAPLAAMVTPGISILNRAHMSRMLPDTVDKGIEWILMLFHRVVVGPVSSLMHMLF
jgi:hypothetical protein